MQGDGENLVIGVSARAGIGQLEDGEFG